MAESPSLPDIDLSSPPLSARLRELADYLSAPVAGRLTEEQRALSLGIARRLVADVAARLDASIDATSLWGDWLAGGVPGPERYAAVCFARAEEHRWREQSVQHSGPPEKAIEAGEASVTIDAPLSATDRAYLALQIADRRRFDALGQPALSVADLGPIVFGALIHDIAAWRLAEVSLDQTRAAALGDAVRAAICQQANDCGIDAAGMVYHDLLVECGILADAAEAAISRHDWPALIALAAAAERRTYGDMALAILTAEIATLPLLLAPLRLDNIALAPLEMSLVMLPARAVVDRSGGA